MGERRGVGERENGEFSVKGRVEQGWGGGQWRRAAGREVSVQFGERAVFEETDNAGAVEGELPGALLGGALEAALLFSLIINFRRVVEQALEDESKYRVPDQGEERGNVNNYGLSMEQLWKG